MPRKKKVTSTPSDTARTEKNIVEQASVGQLINNLIDLNTAKNLDYLATNRQEFGIDTETATQISNVIKGHAEQTRGIALEQVVKLYQ